MSYRLIVSSAVAISCALAACTPKPPTPLPKPDGICGRMVPVSLDSIDGKTLTVGRAVFWTDKTVYVDAEVVGGGGGGGGSRAASEAYGGAGGTSAVSKPIYSRIPLDRGYYLVEVGRGGEFGRGGWGWGELHKSNGFDGGPTRLSRCSSGASLADSDGGRAGKGDLELGEQYDGGRGKAGANFINAGTGKPTGIGGQGGAPGELGGDGFDGGPGAGGGGQGRTNTKNDGASHGGRGGTGFARITKLK